MASDGTKMPRGKREKKISHGGKGSFGVSNARKVTIVSFH